MVLPAYSVLVVEDDLSVSAVIQRFLVASNYSVRVVRTIADAIIALEDERPSIVLTDWGLAGEETGGELARRLKADARYWAVPVIGMTGSVQTHQFDPAAFDATIEKPFGSKALLETLRPFLPTASATVIAPQ